MRDSIATALESASKRDNKRAVATLRLIQAAIADRDSAARSAGRDPLSDADIVKLLRMMHVQRAEAATNFENAGRVDAAAAEREEMAVIDCMLPEQMSDAEVRAACTEVIQDLDARGVRDTGRCMDALRNRHPGKMDFCEASAVVRRLLS